MINKVMNLKSLNTLKFFMAIALLVGLIGFSIQETRRYTLMTTPFVLSFLNLVVLIHSIKNGNKNLFYWIIFVFFFCIAIEVIGVNMGVIFGEYMYEGNLGLTVFGTPVLIGLLWVNIVHGSIIIIQNINQNIILKSLLVSVLTVILDFFLEPFAINLNLWEWQNSDVPIQNYLAWGIISFSLSILYFIGKCDTKSYLVREFFYMNMILFIAFNVINVN